MKKALLWICILAIIAAAVFLIWKLLLSEPVQDTIVVQEVHLSDLPDEIRQQAQSALNTAGMHVFRDKGATYVLLTYGEASGYKMNVMPHINNADVFFRVYADRTEEVSGDYKIYSVRNGQSVFANTAALRNPEYMPGVRGTNVGLISVNEEHQLENIIAILDPNSNDTSFNLGGDVYLPSTGLYEYEYTVMSTGTCITSAKLLDSFTFPAEFDSVDAESRTATDRPSGLTMSYDENIGTVVKQAAANAVKRVVTVVYDNRTVRITDFPFMKTEG